MQIPGGLPVAPALRLGFDRHLTRALQNRSGAKASLRKCVTELAKGMAMAGMSDSAIRAEFVQSVDRHPDRHAWDRLLIVSGQRTSDVLVSQIGAWIDEACVDARAQQTPAPILVRKR